MYSYLQYKEETLNTNKKKIVVNNNALKYEY